MESCVDKFLYSKQRSYNINVLIKHRNHRERKCQALISKDVSRNTTEICPTVWDGVVCWTNVKAGSNFSQPCPDYVPGFHPNGTAFKYCTPKGQWYFDKERNSSWTDFSQCFQTNSVIRLQGTSGPQHSHQPIMEHWIPIIKTMSQVGYAVSFITLIFAFLILISIKKLRCPRNTLHSHLFVSFMLRAFMAILKDILFQKGIGLSISILEGKSGLIFRYNQPNWECKLVTSLWQYCIVANYIWILMEGLYLHNLIFITPLTMSSSVMPYVLLGWGCPLVFIVAWVIARTSLENTLCWTTNSNRNLFLIIRLPIIISVVLNFIFYLNIIRVLFLKLRTTATMESRTSVYKKWAKSTLVLVPLFGVHYMLFLWMSSYIDIDSVIEVIWLFCDQFFASFQGFCVAVLYCLLNGEVRNELNRKWRGRHSYPDETPRTARNCFCIPVYQISTKCFNRSKEIRPDNFVVHFSASEHSSAHLQDNCLGSSLKKDFYNHFHHIKNGTETVESVEV